MHPIRQQVARIYRKKIRPHLTPLNQQRFKLLRTVWGYAPLLGVRALSRGERLRLLGACLRVDWCVEHSHWPGELALLISAMGERLARDGEIVVECGCWKGGGTAKFSVACQLLGYRLHVYDSFQGVEPGKSAAGENDFSGEYACPEADVRRTVEHYGAPEVVSYHAGWYYETLDGREVPGVVRAAYIDCDIVSGTEEALRSILPALAVDGLVSSQDWHIRPVRAYLTDPASWARLGVEAPRIEAVYRGLVLYRPDVTERTELSHV